MKAPLELKFRHVEPTEVIEYYVRIRANRLHAADPMRRCAVEIRRTDACTSDPYRVVVTMERAAGGRFEARAEHFDQGLAVRAAFDEADRRQEARSLAEARPRAARVSFSIVGRRRVAHAS